MVDVDDVDALRFVVDAVQNAVGAAACAVEAGQLSFEWLADSAWFACEVAEDELDDGRNDPGWDIFHRSSRGAGELDVVGHAGGSVLAWGYAEFGSDRFFAGGVAGFDVGVGLGDRVADAWLRQPEQRLLNGLPLVEADEYRRR